MTRFLCTQVLEDDGLPTSICLECVTKVNVAYELREQCQKADMKLRKLYGKALRKSIADNCISTKVLTILPQDTNFCIIHTTFITYVFSCRTSIVRLNNFISLIRSNRKIIQN